MLLLVFGCIARLILVRYNTALRGGSRAAARSKMEQFVITVNGRKPVDAFQWLWVDSSVLAICLVATFLATLSCV